MNYYVHRYECDQGCGEVEDVEADGLPLFWEEVEGEELCRDCAKQAKEDIAKRDADEEA